MLRPRTANVNVQEFGNSGNNPLPLCTKVPDVELLDEFLSPRKLQSLTGVSNLDTVEYLEMRVDAEQMSLGNFGVYLPNLKQLKMSNSIIQSIRDLGTALNRLEVLWMAQSCMDSLDGLSTMSGLRELYVPFNEIKDVSPCGMLENLEILDLEGNLIDENSNIAYLAMCPNLHRVTLQGNPICCQNLYEPPMTYRKSMANLLPNVKFLDDLSNDDENIRFEASSEDPHKKTFLNRSNENVLQKISPTETPVKHDTPDSDAALLDVEATLEFDEHWQYINNVLKESGLLSEAEIDQTENEVGTVDQMENRVGSSGRICSRAGNLEEIVEEDNNGTSTFNILKSSKGFLDSNASNRLDSGRPMTSSSSLSSSSSMVRPGSALRGTGQRDRRRIGTGDSSFADSDTQQSKILASVSRLSSGVSSSHSSRPVSQASSNDGKSATGDSTTVEESELTMGTVVCGNITKSLRKCRPSTASSNSSHEADSRPGTAVPAAHSIVVKKPQKSGIKPDMNNWACPRGDLSSGSIEDGKKSEDFGRNRPFTSLMSRAGKKEADMVASNAPSTVNSNFEDADFDKLINDLRVWRRTYKKNRKIVEEELAPQVLVINHDDTNVADSVDDALDAIINATTAIVESSATPTVELEPELDANIKTTTHRPSRLIQSARQRSNPAAQPLHATSSNKVSHQTSAVQKVPLRSIVSPRAPVKCGSIDNRRSHAQPINDPYLKAADEIILSRSNSTSSNTSKFVAGDPSTNDCVNANRPVPLPAIARNTGTGSAPRRISQIALEENGYSAAKKTPIPPSSPASTNSSISSSIRLRRNNFSVASNNSTSSISTSEATSSKHQNLLPSKPNFVNRE